MKVVLIDDDGITNMLNTYFLEEHFRGLEILSYNDAANALFEL